MVKFCKGWLSIDGNFPCCFPEIKERSEIIWVPWAFQLLGLLVSTVSTVSTRYQITPDKSPLAGIRRNRYFARRLCVTHASPEMIIYGEIIEN